MSLGCIELRRNIANAFSLYMPLYQLIWSGELSHIIDSLFVRVHMGLHVGDSIVMYEVWTVVVIQVATKSDMVHMR